MYLKCHLVFLYSAFSLLKKKGPFISEEKKTLFLRFNLLHLHLLLQMNFDDSSEDEEDLRKRYMERKLLLLKKAQQKALELEEQYAYDEVYDEMKLLEEKRGGEITGSRYIESLLSEKSKREEEMMEIADRKIRDRIDREAHLYGDKEVFVSSSYRDMKNRLKSDSSEVVSEVAGEKSNPSVANQDDVSQSATKRTVVNQSVTSQDDTTSHDTSQTVTSHRSKSHLAQDKFQQMLAQTLLTPQELEEYRTRYFQRQRH